MPMCTLVFTNILPLLLSSTGWLLGPGQWLSTLWVQPGRLGEPCVWSGVPRGPVPVQTKHRLQQMHFTPSRLQLQVSWWHPLWGRGCSANRGEEVVRGMSSSINCCIPVQSSCDRLFHEHVLSTGTFNPSYSYTHVVNKGVECKGLIKSVYPSKWWLCWSNFYPE